MPVYEIVYETGNHSLAIYADDDEAMTALNEHHRRAKAGEPALPSMSGVPAERISKVYVYDNHPADYGVGQEVPVGDLVKVLKKMTNADGLVNVPYVTAAIREATSPFAEEDPDQIPTASQYKMTPSRELEWENV